MTDSLKTRDFQDFLNGLEKLQSDLQSSSTKAWIEKLPTSDQNKIKQFKTDLGNYIKKIRNERLRIIIGDLKKEEDIKAIQEGINDVQDQIDKLNNTISFLSAASKLISTLTNIFGVLALP